MSSAACDYTALTNEQQCSYLIMLVERSDILAVQHMLNADPGLLHCRHPENNALTMIEWLTQLNTLASCPGLVCLLRFHHHRWDAQSPYTGYTLLHELYACGFHHLSAMRADLAALHSVANTNIPATGNHHGSDTNGHFFHPTWDDCRVFSNVVTLMAPPVEIDRSIFLLQQEVIDNNVDPTNLARMSTPDGKTILHWAAERNNLPIVQFTLQNSADVNAEVTGDYHNRRFPVDFCNHVEVRHEIENWS